MPVTVCRYAADRARRLEQEEMDLIRSYKETQLADFLAPEEILTSPYCSDPYESMAELFKDVQEIGEVLLKEHDAKGYLELRSPPATRTRFVPTSRRSIVQALTC